MSRKISFALTFCASALIAQVALAEPVQFGQDFGVETQASRKRVKSPPKPPARAPKQAPAKTAAAVTVAPSNTPTLQAWMSPEIADAWRAGYKGQGTTVTAVDDFQGKSVYSGNFGIGAQSLRHGEWTRLQASMLAPSANFASQDFSNGNAVQLSKSGLNVANLSYGMMARAGYSLNQLGFAPRENSLIAYAKGGSAVIVKSAGNDGIAIGGANAQGNTDYLGMALVGSQSGIFVGALDRNGTTANQANKASYSNYAGADPRVQNSFVMAGVRGDLTGLYGTSFAAPVVSGYAAVLGSKFTSATPTQITNQLLNTARQDTIRGYNPALHGRGEASIARALAPAAIR